MKLISPLYQKEVWKLLYSSPPQAIPLSKSQEIVHNIGEPIVIAIPSPKKEQKSRKAIKSRIEGSREDSLLQTQKRKKVDPKDQRDHSSLAEIGLSEPSSSLPSTLQAEDEEVTDDTSSMNSMTMVDTKTPKVKPIKVHGTAEVWDITTTPSLLDKFNLSF